MIKIAVFILIIVLAAGVYKCATIDVKQQPRVEQRDDKSFEMLRVIRTVSGYQMFHGAFGL